MLSSELAHEVGVLLRSLEQKIRMEADLHELPQGSVPSPTLDHIERAIVSLVVLHVELRKRAE